MIVTMVSLDFSSHYFAKDYKKGVIVNGHFLNSEQYLKAFLVLLLVVIISFYYELWLHAGCGIIN